MIPHQFIGFDHEQRPDVFLRHPFCRGQGGFFAADGFDGSFHEDAARTIDIGQRLYRTAVGIDEVSHEIADRDHAEHVRPLGHDQVPHVWLASHDWRRPSDDSGRW